MLYALRTHDSASIEVPGNDDTDARERDVDDRRVEKSEQRAERCDDERAVSAYPPLDRLSRRQRGFTQRDNEPTLNDDRSILNAGRAYLPFGFLSCTTWKAALSGSEMPKRALTV